MSILCVYVATGTGVRPRRRQIVSQKMGGSKQETLQVSSTYHS